MCYVVQQNALVWATHILLLHIFRPSPNLRNFPYVSIGDRSQSTEVCVNNALDVRFRSSSLIDTFPYLRTPRKVYALVWKSTRLEAGYFLLRDIGWSAENEDEFLHFELALEQHVTLAQAYQQKRLFVYTDASDFFWHGVFTQITLQN